MPLVEGTHVSHSYVEINTINHSDTVMIVGGIRVIYHYIGLLYSKSWDILRYQYVE